MLNKRSALTDDEFVEEYTEKQGHTKLIIFFVGVRLHRERGAVEVRRLRSILEKLWSHGIIVKHDAQWGIASIIKQINAQSGLIQTFPREGVLVVDDASIDLLCLVEGNGIMARRAGGCGWTCLGRIGIEPDGRSGGTRLRSVSMIERANDSILTLLHVACHADCQPRRQ
jgi:hypothetical protein